MSADFFLLSRAHQIQRLYGVGGDKPVQRPNDKLLARSPQPVRYFYGLLDHICAIANELLLSEGSAQLNDSQRQVMREFEEIIVLNRFAADEEVKNAAVQMIKAIFNDSAQFSGLKPLPQYREKFAYELLFPSWLNLLSAVMLPRSGSSTGQARLDGPHQVEFFRHVFECPLAKGETGEQYVGFLTFIASRNDAPHCEQMLQRIVELVERHGASVVQMLAKIDQSTTDGVILAQRFSDYLIAKYSQESWGKPQYLVAAERPQVRALPAFLSDRLNALEQADDCEAYCRFAADVACIVLSKQAISIDLSTAIHKHPSALDQLIHWSVRQHHPPMLLTESSQSLLGHVVSLEFAQAPNAEGIAKLQNLVKHVIVRAANLGEKATEYFREQFLNQSDNRTALLDACDAPAKLQKIAAMLLDHASKTDSTDKFINLLSCVTILDQSDVSLEAQVSLNALQSVIENRSIGNKELSDIITDLQQHLPTALATLASPLSQAAEKSERLITLYLALNEVGQTIVHSGMVGNFGIVRAKYSRFSQMG